MLKIAARRPARVDRTPRRTRATAPAHSKPSCTGAFFLDFASFIEQNPHEEKRDPNSRSTLHHSFGLAGTRIPPSFGRPGMGDRLSGRRPTAVDSLVLSRGRCYLCAANLHPVQRSERSRAAL